MKSFNLYIHAALSAILLCGGCATTSATWDIASVAPPTSVESVLARDNEESRPVEGGIVEAVAVTGDAYALTLGDAVAQAMARNRGLAVQVFGPEISAQGIDEARAIFDPTLSVTASHAEQNTPRVVSTTVTGSRVGIDTTASTLDQAIDTAQLFLSETATIAALFAQDAIETTTTRSTGVNTRISQYLPTGTELYVSASYTKDQSSLSEDDEYGGSWNVGITQPLLRGAGTKVNLVALKQARNNAAISELAFRDFVLSLVQEVEDAYWGLALAQETLAIQQFSMDLAHEQLRLNEALIAVGKLAGSAIVSAEAEVASQASALVDAEAALRNQTITVWRLLNPEGQAPATLTFGAIALPVLDAPVLDGEASVRLAEAFRPDLAQARLDVANSELQVMETKNGLLPQLDAFASYGVLSRGMQAGAWNDYLDDTEFDQFEVGLRFNVALGRRAEKARHRRARYQEDQAHAAVLNLAQSVEAEVRQAVVEVLRQYESIGASEQEVAAREEELRIERDQFRLGRSTNLDVLQVQQRLIQAKLSLATAQVGYLQSLTNLYRTEGTLLTRRGIVLPSTTEFLQ